MTAPATSRHPPVIERALAAKARYVEDGEAVEENLHRRELSPSSGKPASRSSANICSSSNRSAAYL